MTILARRMQSRRAYVVTQSLASASASASTSASSSASTSKSALAPQAYSAYLLYPLSYTFYIRHTHALGQDLSMHTKILTTVTLTLTLESAFRFQNLCLGFLKLIITPILNELHLSYLANTCIGTRPFHACQNFDPCDLDLELSLHLGFKICVQVSKIDHSSYTN